MTRVTNEAGDREGPILVVDDDPHLREALAALLAAEGHRVLLAADGPTARALTLAHAPSLVVVERLAGRRGVAALRALRGALEDATPALPLPALLLTDAPLAGVEDAAGLEKPFNVRDLLLAVERYRRRVPREAS
ncbi:MAG: response regulator [Sandaracinaceae bacterium]|nr:response regulator [Sandaracinaceae bacterium]